jgi:hypothetical protein
MSENLDLVRSICAAWERGDFSSAKWADPQIEFVVEAHGPTSSGTSGLEGMAESFRGYLSTWKAYRVEAYAYRELDHERVLVLVHGVGSGKASGLDLTRIRSNEATLFHIREGTVRRLVIYPDGDRALADLGLEE